MEFYLLDWLDVLRRLTGMDEQLEGVDLAGKGLVQQHSLVVLLSTTLKNMIHP